MQTSALKLIASAILQCLLFLVASSLSSHAQTDIWVQKSDLGYSAANVPEPTARFRAVGFSINSKGYIGTGSDVNGITKDFWEYDPSVSTWTQKADFAGTARWMAVGFRKVLPLWGRI